MENLLTILKNIECQFQVDGFLDDNKTWTLENHQKFWRDFEGVSAILKHEINKLALVIDVNEDKKTDEKDIQKLIDSVEKACVTLWSTFLTLSLQAGRTFCQEISNIGQIIVHSTYELVRKLQNCSSRQEALQSVGEIWEKCERLQSTVPRNNAEAVCQAIHGQRNLVQDAIQELEDTKNLQNDGDIDEDDFETKWTEVELAVLGPALGLLKTAQALLKKINLALKEKGNSFDYKSVTEMDEILKEILKISPLVDDFALSLYPSLTASEIDINKKSLIQHCQSMLDHLKSIHFVQSKDLEQWGNFLIKALNHNQSKLDIALTQLKLTEVEIK